MGLAHEVDPEKPKNKNIKRKQPAPKVATSKKAARKPRKAADASTASAGAAPGAADEPSASPEDADAPAASPAVPSIKVMNKRIYSTAYKSCLKYWLQKDETIDNAKGAARLAGQQASANYFKSLAGLQVRAIECCCTLEPS